MFPIRCTVRKCHQMLHTHDDGLRCEAGHHFNASRQGYWNLLQPQDRRSSKPGDNDDAVLARRRWLERQHMDGLAQVIRELIAKHLTGTPKTMVDLGCGEGTLSAQVFNGTAEECCGIDLSKTAMKLAARSFPNATWVLANADRALPLADATIDCVMSLFGRRPIEEFARILSPHGLCVIAIPGPEDLVQLREHVQLRGDLRSRTGPVIQQATRSGLQPVEQARWSRDVILDREGILDAMSMTYRGVRHSQRERLAELDSISVRLDVDLIVLTR